MLLVYIFSLGIFYLIFLVGRLNNKYKAVILREIFVEVSTLFAFNKLYEDSLPQQHTMKASQINLYINV